MTDEYFRDTVSYFPSIRKVQPRVETKSIKLNIEHVPVHNTNLSQENDVSVVKMDTFNCAEHMIKEEKLNPLVLNMASDFHPGGGWRKGSLAQEESLFYRSTYDLTLNTRSIRYPLSPTDIVYSPYVYVFKDSNYDLMPWDSCFGVACLAVAGIRNPKLDHGHLMERDRKLTKLKIKSIYDVAKCYGHNSLVLSALGCGAFHNPHEDIAKIFREVNKECKYGLTVRFAILHPNYIPFKNILE